MGGVKAARPCFHWFCEHLDAPSVAELERFWFREEAVEHIARAQRLAALVRAAGIPIVERRTRRLPGKVRYDDASQVAVIPSRDTPGQPARRRRASKVDG